MTVVPLGKAGFDGGKVGSWHVETCILVLSWPLHLLFIPLLPLLLGLFFAAAAAAAAPAAH